MPTAEAKKRGVKRTRTVHPPGRPDKYIHVDVVKKAGPKGGHTVAGPVHTVKHHCPAEPL